MREPAEIMQLPQEALLTVAEAAIVMNVGQKYMRRLIKTGAIAHLRWGTEPRVPRWALRKWQESQVDSIDLRVQRILGPTRRRRSA